ncbi:MAG TPA: DUF3717 domain-containing protein [Burkholderiaceae bacterium]
MDLTLPAIEEAINFWRARCPSTGEERALSPQVNALARIYALMIYHRVRTVPVSALDAPTQQLLQTWLAERPAS